MFLQGLPSLIASSAGWVMECTLCRLTGVQASAVLSVAVWVCAAMISHSEVTLIWPEVILYQSDASMYWAVQAWQPSVPARPKHHVGLGFTKCQNHWDQLCYRYNRSKNINYSIGYKISALEIHFQTHINKYLYLFVVVLVFQSFIILALNRPQTAL